MFNENMLYGIHIGEHGFDENTVIKEINERVIKPGYNFVTIRTRARFGELVAHETYLKWARLLAENKIYFLFLYTIKTGEKLTGSIAPETVSAMKEIAGEYFLGDMVGELGSCFGAKHSGYRTPGGDNPHVIPKQDFTDVKSAADEFVRIVKDYTELDRSIGMPHIASVEPTALSKYVDMGGVDLPMLELMCAYPDVLVSYMRGMARAFDRTWGTYMAHEWYGGMRHDDMLKRKRLQLGVKYAYLAGSRVFCIESGDELVTAYGNRYETDSEICQDYRDAVNWVKGVADSEKRHEDGPRVKLAFVSGRYDSYCGWGGSSAWGQYDREEWGHSEPEHSWRLLSEIGTKRQWYDIENYGETDSSALPAYGMYDIAPIEADVDALSRYDYLIFLGWNTMTDEDMDKLTEYVRRGGRLLMSAAHLNYSTKRSGELVLPPDEKMRALFGATLDGTVTTNAGVKFDNYTLDPTMRYPVTNGAKSDPIFSEGYHRFAIARPSGANVLAIMSDGFTRSNIEPHPAILENRVGEGYATLVTSLEYPSHLSLYPLYRAMVREWISASARECEVKVIAPDRLRYSVYTDGSIYLLNTDYDIPVTARIVCGDKEQTVTVDSLEMKKISM